MRNALICLFFTILALPLFSDGVQPLGSGTQADPYQIATLDNLLWVSTNQSCWDDWFIQTVFIDASDTQNWNGGEGWRPIGYYIINAGYHYFSGHYNGQGNIIAGLYTNHQSDNCQGLFGCIRHAEITNLGLWEAEVHGHSSIGSLVGYCCNSTISFCFATGSVYGENSVGGLVGYSNTNSIIENCYAINGVEGEGTVGGLVGCCSANSVIDNCYALNDVTGDENIGGLVGYCSNGSTVSTSFAVGDVTGNGFIGGLVGLSENSTIYNSNATGNVCGTSNVGGLVGKAYLSVLSDCCASGSVEGTENIGGLLGMNFSGALTNCCANGDISGDSNIGGLVGYCFFECSLINCFATGIVWGSGKIGGLVGMNTHSTITNCYATGGVSGTEYVGGLVGYNCQHGTMHNCYSIGSVLGDSRVGGLVGQNIASNIYASFWNTETSSQSTSAAGTGLTTAQMQTLSTYLDAGWDFMGETANGTDDIWGLNSHANNGYPFLAWQGYEHDPDPGMYPEGLGTEADPYQIATLDNLLWMSANDDCQNSYFIQTADIDASDTRNWNDGEGWEPIGYFNYGEGLHLFRGHYNGQGHTIDSLYINRPNGEYQALFGYVNNAHISDLVLTNAQVCGYFQVAALVARTYNYTVIERCYCSGDIYGETWAGGLVGANYQYSTIEDCQSDCNVGGRYMTGGFVGSNHYHSTIRNCSSSGNVSNTADIVGGFAGENHIDALIERSFCTGDVDGSCTVGGFVGHNYVTATVQDCYCMGDVNGGIYVGGFTAVMDSASSIVNCYRTGATIADSLVGGFAAFLGDSSVTASFWNIETSGCDSSAAGTGLTTAQMQDMATYLNAGWDFVGETANGTDDIWDLINDFNDGYPCLAWEYAVDTQEETVPAPVAVTRLEGNYPNPFNPSTTIRFAVAPGQTGALDIYNARGQRVCGWGGLAPGEHSITWNGRDDRGRAVASGVYFYRLSAGDHAQTRKMMLLK